MIGVVELEEGVRIFGLLDAPVDELAIGQPVTASRLHEVPGITLFAFRPL